MKTSWVIGGVALFTCVVGVVWGLIHYYYQMKELAREATARHRAAALAETRARAAEDRARTQRAHARQYYENALKLRDETTTAIENLTKALNHPRLYKEEEV